MASHGEGRTAWGRIGTNWDEWGRMGTSGPELSRIGTNCNVLGRIRQGLGMDGDQTDPWGGTNGEVRIGTNGEGRMGVYGDRDETSEDE